MRLAAIFLGTIVVLAMGSLELRWRINHPAALPDAWSWSRSRVAELHFMPESSVAPYGIGVFIRSKWAVFHGLQSELAFAGYCSDISTGWQSEERLGIRCELVEGEPFVAGPVVNGTELQLTVLRRQASAAVSNQRPAAGDGAGPNAPTVPP